MVKITGKVITRCNGWKIEYKVCFEKWTITNEIVEQQFDSFSDAVAHCIKFGT